MVCMINAKGGCMKKDQTKTSAVPSIREDKVLFDPSVYICPDEVKDYGNYRLPFSCFADS